MSSGDDSASAPGTIRLYVVGDAAVRAYGLPHTGRVVIGRAHGSDVCIDDPTMSRRHAALEVGSGVVLEDLGSANGTFVAGQRLVPGRGITLRAGELFELGSVMLLIQRDVASAAAPLEPLVAPTLRPPPELSRERAPEVAGAEMKRLYELARRIAASTLPVVITGETGVGKDLMAEFIHKSSPRSGAVLVRLNCATSAEHALEAQLLGRGGAGLLQIASGGNMFLDELGELTAASQAKLLGVLESGTPSGLPFDVRFIATTRRDLPDMVDAGAFSRELFARLNGVMLAIPPLRDRREEIAPLAELFLRAASDGRSITFSSSARNALRSYAWPGNVTQLKHVVARAALLSREATIDASDLGPEIAGSVGAAEQPEQGSGSYASLRRQRDEFERQRLVQVLDSCAGDHTRAAKRLGISRRALVARLATLGVPKARSR